MKGELSQSLSSSSVLPRRPQFRAFLLPLPPNLYLKCSLFCSTKIVLTANPAFNEPNEM